MTSSAGGKRRVVWLAIAFELSLLLAAQFVGWLLGVSPLEGLEIRLEAALLALLATLPPLGLMLLLSETPWEPFRHLMRELDEHLLPLFRTCSPLELALIALAAGVGEEALFRGAILAGVGRLTTPVIGLAAASILFGLAHLITRTYAVLAGIIGLYLGGLVMLSDNLFIPIIVHATYDFVALSFWLHVRPVVGGGSSRSSSE